MFKALSLTLIVSILTWPSFEGLYSSLSILYFSLGFSPVKRWHITLYGNIYNFVLAHMWRKLWSYLHSYLNSPHTAFPTLIINFWLRKEGDCAPPPPPPPPTMEYLIHPWIGDEKDLFVCLFWFFTSHQQSFSYIGTGLPGLNQY